MKRDRDHELGEVESRDDIANCLMLLSKVGETEYLTKNSKGGRVFRCKTCNKQFTSFQALGGHRASHKKPKLTSGSDIGSDKFMARKPKVHECPICGLEFQIGQALGGHMRRHKGGLNERILVQQRSTSGPILKKSNSKRVFLCLDLNLTPLENDLKLNLSNVHIIFLHSEF
ncbi:Zinc finger protein [Quillaja saponaria]|uniref:Zinc finger protein n=1 Tax=Quillaja saponaria TaxID=32244 RepID=A0AAD7QG60_QUISA|nr:Zinc finger protein [Quillaja saponaria]